MLAVSGDSESASVRSDAVTGGKRIQPDWMLAMGEAVQQIQVEKRYLLLSSLIAIECLNLRNKITHSNSHEGNNTLILLHVYVRMYDMLYRQLLPSCLLLSSNSVYSRSLNIFQVICSEKRDIPSKIVVTTLSSVCALLDTGVVVFMKKLDFTPTCALSYKSGEMNHTYINFFFKYDRFQVD